MNNNDQGFQFIEIEYSVAENLYLKRDSIQFNFKRRKKNCSKSSNNEHIFNGKTIENIGRYFSIPNLLFFKFNFFRLRNRDGTPCKDLYVAK